MSIVNVYAVSSNTSSIQTSKVNTARVQSWSWDFIKVASDLKYFFEPVNLILATRLAGSQGLTSVARSLESCWVGRKNKYEISPSHANVSNWDRD